ncbi:MAG: hypothetical protein QHC90_11205 [Shinella sp.]|nr:hypothetical protein [Shinella sp.]
MIKLIVTGVWICVITLASVYFSMRMAAAPGTDDEAATSRAALEFVRGSTTTVPVIADGEVRGYFLANLSYTANTELAAGQAVPLPQMITDELYTLLVGNRIIDIADLGGFDLGNFRTAVKDGLNKRFGKEVIAEVFVEQIDYITKADVQSGGPKKGVTIAKGGAPAALTSQPSAH